MPGVGCQGSSKGTYPRFLSTVCGLLFAKSSGRRVGEGDRHQRPGSPSRPPDESRLDLTDFPRYSLLRNRPSDPITFRSL